MTILVETHADYRLITLNRPERLNALTVEMAEALSAALDAAEADSSCRRRRRRRQPRAGLRHRAGGARRQLRPGVRPHRPHPRLRRHLVSAAPRRHGPRPRAGDARRAAAGRDRGRMGDDLAGSSGRRVDGGGARSRGPAGERSDRGARLDQAGAGRERRQRSRQPARPRTRPAGRGLRHPGPCRGAAGISRQTSDGIYRNAVLNGVHKAACQPGDLCADRLADLR